MKQNSKEYTPIAKEWITNFSPPNHTPIKINDGISAKVREIIVPTDKEIIVHHAVVNVLKPVLRRGMYEHSYASIPGKGLHTGAKLVKKWLRKDYKNTKYCLKLDIKKFFESIDQNILLEKLSKIIRDKLFFNYVKKIVRTVPRGIPLGFTTSQWFANFLLTDLDHKIKEEMGIKYYIRYMDDMILFGANKRKLHSVREQISDYLESKLNLSLKDNWQLFLMDGAKGRKKGRFLDFLGFKFYRKHTGLRSKLAMRIQRKAKRISKKDRATIKDARQMVTYAGIAKYADCHRWFEEHVLRYVSIKRLRQKISNYSKNQREGGVAYVV